MLEFNIAPNTQVGRIIIPNKVYQNENAYRIPEEKYSRGGEFIENMVTDNIIEFCKRWFNLAGFSEVLEDIDEFYQNRGFGRFSNLMKAGFAQSPIIPVSDYVQSPIEFTGSPVQNPIIFYNKKTPDLTYEHIISKGVTNNANNS